MNKTDEKVHRARFTGLSQQQAVRLIEIDAQALWTKDHEDVKKAVAAYVELGLTLTPAVMLMYAHLAAEHHKRTGRGFWWTPEGVWYEALHEAGESEPLKIFLGRRRPLDMATRHAELVGTEALRKMAWQIARENDNPRRAETPMTEALEAFIVCGDKDGMRFVLATAIGWGDLRLAEKAAAGRKRTLSKCEKLEICRAMIRSDYNFRDKTQMIIDLGFARQIGHELIKDALGRKGFMRDWHNFQSLCEQLGKKPESYMGRWFLAQRGEGNELGRAYVAEELLKRRSLFWKDAVHNTLRVERADCLKATNYEEADRLGQLIDEPLTIGELTQIINDGHGVLRGLEEDRRYAFAKSLLAERLTEPVASPPTPPAADATV